MEVVTLSESELLAVYVNALPSVSVNTLEKDIVVGLSSSVLLMSGKALAFTTVGASFTAVTVTTNVSVTA